MDESDELLDYLSLLDLDHRVTLVIRANKLLKDIGHFDHIDVFNTVISFSDNYENNEFFTRVEDLVKEHLVENITEFGISLSNEKLDVLIEILEALYTIESRDDSVEINSLCAIDGDAIDVFCDILQHIYGRNEIDYMECIGSVDPNLIGKIEAITEPTMLDEFNEIEKMERNTLENIKIKVKYILNKIEAPIFSNMLADGVRLGYNHDTYMLQIEDNEDISISDYVNEFIVSYVASDCDIDKLSEKLSARLETLYDNVNLISTEMLRVASIVNELKEFSYGAN